MNEANRGRYEHYKLVRESPEYRMELKLIEMESLMAPSLNQDVPKPYPSYQTVPLPEHRLMNKVKQLEAIVYGVRADIQRHTNSQIKRKGKVKPF